MQLAVDHATRPATAPDGTRIVALADRLDPASLTLGACRSPESLFGELASMTARRANVEPRALGVRALLHLPRVAASNGKLTKVQVERELFHSARFLHQDRGTVQHLIPRRKFALQDLVFTENFDEGTASRLFSSLHYLKSARPGSQNFALLDPVDGSPVTICSVSPFEWKRIGLQIQSQFGIPRERVWDVSRVYSFDVAPPNAISFLLSRVRSSLGRSTRTVDLLVTAVDPNLGFTGSSYRAANWQQWMTIQPRPYLYHDRRYASPRQLRQRFGTSSLGELKVRHPGQCFEQSRARLLDSLIFCSRINGETEPVPIAGQRPLRR